MGAQLAGMAPDVLSALPAFVELVRMVLNQFNQKPERDGPAMAEEEQRTGKSRDQLVREARQALPGFNPDKYNFAVCGPARSGKSTMVNVLRGVKDGDPEAAKVGEVECTLEITSYPINRSHLVVWDLPGCGTMRHPLDGYFENKKLYAFDGLILTYSSGLDESTVALYEQCVERQVPVMLVRTQADKAFEAKTRRMSPEQAIAAMHDDFDKELNDLDLDESTNAFYVSMWDLVSGKPKMDEQEFLQTVLQFGRQRGNGKARAVVAAPAVAVPAPVPVAVAVAAAAALGTKGELMKVLYDFEGQESMHLTIVQADVVTLLQSNGEWSFVETSGGKRGLVPTTYICPLFEGAGRAPPPPAPKA